MSKLLLNLRNVPEDEADEVRDWLRRERIGFYETRPSPWGISHGGIWLEDDADFERAGTLMAGYQQARAQHARAQAERLRQEGRGESFARTLRQRPLFVVAVLAAMLAIVALTLALPWWLLR